LRSGCGCEGASRTWPIVGNMFATTYFLTEAPLMLVAANVFRRPLQPA
jgi:hypothetical protein